MDHSFAPGSFNCLRPPVLVEYLRDSSRISISNHYGKVLSMSASNRVGGCFIWPNSPGSAYTRGGGDHTIDVEESPRAGGKYSITEEARMRMNMGDVDDRTKARLTTLLINLRLAGFEWPEVDANLLAKAANSSGLGMAERTVKLLHHLYDRSEYLGAVVQIGGESEPHSVSWSLDKSPTACAALAWSESLEWAELEQLVKLLEGQGLIEMRKPGAAPLEIVVTAAGHLQVEQSRNDDPKGSIGFLP